jgi:hypothetical protein
MRVVGNEGGGGGYFCCLLAQKSKRKDAMNATDPVTADVALGSCSTPSARRPTPGAPAPHPLLHSKT